MVSVSVLMIERILPRSLIQAAAFFWGIACFLPVGVSYAAALLLIVALGLRATTRRPELSQRTTQVRQHAAFWPLCFFAIWTLVILVAQPNYAETPSNLFHGFRIILTITLVLLLLESELKSAVFGWIMGATLGLTVIYLNQWIALPRVPGFINLVEMKGNKSICIAILLAIFGACTAAHAMTDLRQHWMRFSVLALILIVPVLIWFLPSRTSLLILVISLLVGLIHQFWRRPTLLVGTMMALALVSWGVAQAPQVSQRFFQGFSEMNNTVKSGSQADQDLQHSSWGMRTLMYAHTLDMVKEKPILGWGIGSWNEQWRKRTPAQIHYANMPHNDFLWMGAQAGVVGMLALLAVMGSLFVSVIRMRSIQATCSMIASTGLLVATTFNSALRDAQIGMSVLFVVFALNAWALTHCRNHSST